MLTTIRMGRANVYSYLIAKWSEYQEIYPLDEIRSEEETDEEYSVRQLYLMDSSKSNAIEVAYKKAGIPIDYQYNGVYVLNVIADMPRGLSVLYQTQGRFSRRGRAVALC